MALREHLPRRRHRLALDVAGGADRADRECVLARVNLELERGFAPLELAPVETALEGCVLLVRSELEFRGGLRGALGRSLLDRRCRLANEARSDRLISIHRDRAGRGPSTT